MIFSREQILARVWNNEVIVLDRTIDVNITRLRKKIGPYGSHLVTRLGYGYGLKSKHSYQTQSFLWLLGFSWLLIVASSASNTTGRRSCARSCSIRSCRSSTPNWKRL